ncbi:hypothetical protein [Candidatus Palauibacter sp.]|uniref:hypothetical protein n=1 Tax=Candidatus Palauibacter sp. TaxID=3101350 RepID=UPI003B5BF646
MTRTAVVIWGPAEPGPRDWTQLGEPIEYEHDDSDISHQVTNRIAEAAWSMTVHAGDQFRVLDLDQIEEEGIDLRGWQ